MTYGAAKVGQGSDRVGQDVEVLVAKAYGSHLVDKATGGPAVSEVVPSCLLGRSGWDTVAQIAVLGTRVDGGGAGGSAGEDVPAWALEVHRAVMSLPSQAAAVVVRHARIGARPEWSAWDRPFWVGVPAPGDRGVMVERHRVDGYVVSWCPVYLDREWHMVELARSEYVVWWEALALVAREIGAKFSAPKTPWLDKPALLGQPRTT